MSTANLQTTVLSCLWDQPTELGQIVALLAACGVSEPASRSMGDVDRQLLAVHERFAGAGIEFTAACPRCEADNAFVVSSDLLPPDEPVSFLVGRHGGVRAPRLVDLLDLPDDPEEAESVLVQRCSVGEPTEPPMPGHLAQAVAHDEVRLVGLSCIECGHDFDTEVDLSRAVLGALVARAMVLDREVHLLAATYGWSLGDIERLSDGRREHLVGLIQGDR